MDVGRVRAAGASLVTVALLGLGASPALAAPGVVGLGGQLAEGGRDGRHADGQGRQRHRPRDARAGRRPDHAPRDAAPGRSGARRSTSPRTARPPTASPSSSRRGCRRATTTSSACTPYGTGAGKLGCATAQRRRADQGRHPGPRHAGRLRAGQGRAGRRPAAPAAARWPSRAPGCTRRRATPATRSSHTDVNLVYDAPSNLFLPGTHVDLQQRATQCLTDFSLDFERTNDVTSTTTPGPDLTVQSVTSTASRRRSRSSSRPTRATRTARTIPTRWRTRRRTRTRSARPTRTRRPARRPATARRCRACRARRTSS